MAPSIKDNPDYNLPVKDAKKLDKEITKAVKEINKMIKSESKKDEKDHIVGYVKNKLELSDKKNPNIKSFNDSPLFKKSEKNQPINIENVKQRYADLQKFNAEINGKLKQRKDALKPIYKSQVDNQKIINNLTSSIKQQHHAMVSKDEVKTEKNNKITKSEKEQAQSIGKSLRQKLANIVPSPVKKLVTKARGRGE
ncbi:MAG: hypothetical protein EKK61_02025 [Rickettsiales bacterium]|nr:MAG: hypothetical protein EKK61_02025 [Rickettsiales bacterium]